MTTKCYAVIPETNANLSLCWLAVFPIVMEIKREVCVNFIMKTTRAEIVLGMNNFYMVY